ncbi:MAG TPA: hypothetical protein VK509_15255, partial [Polyangiales bacterium]|nr:hypothetical protein [Polyangiales bacterium]
MQYSWRLLSWACPVLVFACTGTDNANQGILAGGAGESTIAGAPAPLAGTGVGGAAGIPAAGGSGVPGPGTAGAAPPAAGAGGAGGSAATMDAGMAQAGADAGSDAATDPDVCDRACLIEVMNTYLTALAAKSSTTLPVSMSLKYT